MAERDFPEVTFGTYYVRDGAEREFEERIPDSWAVLRRLGFIADEAPQLFRSVQAPRRYVEVARWVPGVMDPAHEHPDVIPVWAALAACVQPHTPEVVDRGLVFDEFVPVLLTGD